MEVMTKSPSKKGYDFWNDYLGLKMSFDKGYVFNPKKAYIKEATYRKKKEIKMIEYIANRIGDSKQYLLSCFLCSRNFDFFDLIDRESFFDEQHRKRIERNLNANYVLINEINNIIEKYDIDIMTELLCISTNDIPMFLEKRLFYGASNELLVILNRATKFLSQDNLIYNTNKDIIKTVNSLTIYDSFMDDMPILTKSIADIILKQNSKHRK